MMKNILNFIYPPSCSVCGRRGFYLCPTCHKLFKKNLPECYVCRRISNGFKTHKGCKEDTSLDHVFVAWEYNRLSSDLLKRLKYKSVTDIKGCLGDIFYRSIQTSSFRGKLKDTLLVPVPVSAQRMKDRGFNQTELIARELGKRMSIDIQTDLLKKYGTEHHALMDKDQRLEKRKNPFSIRNSIEIGGYKSITILDDVITTGSTLNHISEVIHKEYGKDIEVNAICMFRGKPYYSDTDV